MQTLAIPGVTMGSPLCPWYFGHSSWRGARQLSYFFVSNIVWSSSLGATIVGSCIFGLPFVLIN